MATIHTALSRGFAKTASLTKFAAMYKEAARRFLDDTHLEMLTKEAKNKPKKAK